MYLILEALLDVIETAGETPVIMAHETTADLLLTPADHPMIYDDADWKTLFSQQLTLDITQSRLLPKTIVKWDKMPYPSALNEMLATSLLFHRLYNGTETLPIRWAKKIQQTDKWLIRLLLFSSAASLALAWTGTSPWKWISLSILLVTSMQLLRWIWIQTQATQVRARIFGCCTPFNFMESQRVMRRRLILLLTERFAGPYAYLKAVRESGGDDATKISSFFRLSPLLTTIFLFLPLASWAGNAITWQWTPYMPFVGATTSLLAALFFFLNHKISMYTKVNVQQFPANVWVFRYFADTIRRLYA